MPGMRRPAGTTSAGLAQGAVLGLEARHTGRVPVNDANSDRAGAATVLALSLRHDITRGAWRLQPFLRVDNLTNRRYAGSVIVNEGNGRFFEPAAGRSILCRAGSAGAAVSAA